MALASNDGGAVNVLRVVAMGVPAAEELAMN